MYPVVPIVESQPILHVKAQSKHAPNHQVSSDYVVCHSISTRVLDYHTRPPTKGSVMNHPVSQFPPLAPNLVTVSNYKQPKAGVSHLVSQLHLIIVTMTLYPLWRFSPHEGRGLLIPNTPIWRRSTLRMKAHRLEGYHTIIESPQKP